MPIVPDALPPLKRDPAAVGRRHRNAVEARGREEQTLAAAVRVHDIELDLIGRGMAARRLKDDPLSIRQEAGMRVASGAVGETPRQFAIGVHDVDFPIAVARRSEDDAPAVGRPLRPRVLGA